MSVPLRLGLITARGGSKGLPGKNVRPLCGKPLIVWTVEAALASGVVDALVVSTDAEDIAEPARKAGADVPFLRPAELATDEATSLAVGLHALDWLQDHRRWHPEWLWLLQPTSPLRTAEHLREAWRLAETAAADSVLGVVRPKHHPAWCLVESPDGALAPLLVAHSPGRRQDLTTVWAPNGAIYLTRVEALRREGRFTAGRCVPLPMTPEESLDIDTSLDFAVCEALLARRPGP